MPERNVPNRTEPYKAECDKTSHTETEYAEPHEALQGGMWQNVTYRKGMFRTTRSLTRQYVAECHMLKRNVLNRRAKPAQACTIPASPPDTQPPAQSPVPPSTKAQADETPYSGVRTPPMPAQGRTGKHKRGKRRIHAPPGRYAAAGTAIPPRAARANGRFLAASPYTILYGNPRRPPPPCKPPFPARFCAPARPVFGRSVFSPPRTHPAAGFCRRSLSPAPPDGSVLTLSSRKRAVFSIKPP